MKTYCPKCNEFVDPLLDTSSTVCAAEAYYVFTSCPYCQNLIHVEEYSKEENKNGKT